MAILFHKLPFTRRGRQAVHGLRAIPWVEELESRYVLATLGPLPSSTLLLIPIANAAKTPALVQQTPSSISLTTAPGANSKPVNVATGSVPFIVGSGLNNISQALTAQTIPVSLTPGAATLGNALLPATNTINQLPPILQGTTVVPPSGPLTFADVQTITANFIGGGHTETPPGPNARPFNPPSTPRQMPSGPPANRPVAAMMEAPPSPPLTAHQPLETTELLVPIVVGFDEGPQLLTDQSEEVQRGTDGGIGLQVVPCAAPVLAAALAAHWADRYRRPEDDDENDDAQKMRVLLSA